MAISTVSNNEDKNAASKREKVISLMEKHKPLFEKEGVTNPKFIPRMAYKHNGELIIKSGNEFRKYIRKTYLKKLY